MYKRIEINNLAEIQKELIDYNFFNRFTGFGDWGTADSETDQVTFSPDVTSAAYFKEIPDLKHLKEFLNNTVNVDLISHFFVMNFEGNYHSEIHLDEDGIWALNIPITNCNDSSTIYYNDNRIEIDRLTLDAPYILNIGNYYHQVINHSDQGRLAMSIRFFGTDLTKIIK